MYTHTWRQQNPEAKDQMFHESNRESNLKESPMNGFCWCLVVLHLFKGRCRTAMSTAVTPPPAEFSCPSLAEPVSYVRLEDALRQWNGVPDTVVAVGVGHVLVPELVHGGDVLWREGESRDDGMGTVAGRLLQLNRVDGTAVEDEIGETGDVGSELVVDLISAAGGRPLGAVPDGSVQRHGFRGVVAGHRFRPLHLSNRHVVDVESGEKMSNNI